MWAIPRVINSSISTALKPCGKPERSTACMKRAGDWMPLRMYCGTCLINTAENARRSRVRILWWAYSEGCWTRRTFHILTEATWRSPAINVREGTMSKNNHTNTGNCIGHKPGSAPGRQIMITDQCVWTNNDFHNKNLDRLPVHSTNNKKEE